MNGWKNRETWNVALWINSDEHYNALARVYKKRGYKAFVETLRAAYPNEFSARTPDGVDWSDNALDINALDALLREL